MKKRAVSIGSVLLLVVMISLSYVSAQTIGGAEVARYTFEADTVEGNKLKDVWGDNNGTINGSIVYPDARSGSDVMGFDGDDYVEIPDDDGLSPERGITVMTWVNFNSIDDHDNLVSKWGDSKDNYNLQLSDQPENNFTFKINLKDSGYLEVFSNTAPKKDNWYHLTGSWDGNNLSIYVDGRMEGSKTSSSERVKGGSFLSMGGESVAGGNKEIRLNGSLDDVRIYNASLSESTINSIYNGNYDPSGILKKTWVYDSDEDGYHKNGSQTKHSSSSPQPKGKWIRLVNSRGKDYCDGINGLHRKGNKDCYSGETSDLSGASCSEDSDCNDLLSRFGQRSGGKEFKELWEESLYCNDNFYCQINTSVGANSKFGSTSPYYWLDGQCSMKGYSNLSSYISDFKTGAPSSDAACGPFDMKMLEHNKSDCFKSPLNLYGKQAMKNYLCDYKNRGFIGETITGFDFSVDGMSVDSTKNYSDTGLRNVTISRFNSNVSFPYNFSENDFNIHDYDMSFSGDNNKGYFSIEGANSSNKTVHMNRQAKSDQVCIKDSSNISGFYNEFILETPEDCSGTNEYLLSCPGNKSGYNCEIIENGSGYKVYPLQHSAVAEYVANDSGGGTTNNSCSKSDWNCTPSDWSNVTCQNGQKNRSCVKKSNVSCSGGYQPNETVSCGNQTLPKCEIDNHYECTVWSDCHKTGDLKGQQTRKCVKQNECKNYDPKEKQDCEVEDSGSSDNEENTNESDFPWTIVLISAGALLLGLIILLIIWKTKSSSSKGSAGDSSSSKSGSSGGSNGSSGGAPVNVNSSGGQQAPQMNAQKKQTAAQRPRQQKMPSRQQAQLSKKKVASQRRNLAPNRNSRARR
ncbi:MAG: LamG domain-containing protein [Candidatus Pacearchaeota archaeon]